MPLDEAKLTQLATQYDPFPVLRELEVGAGNPAGGLKAPGVAAPAPAPAPGLASVINPGALPAGPTPQYMQQAMAAMGGGGAAMSAPGAPAARPTPNLNLQPYNVASTPVPQQTSLAAIINGRR